MACTRRTKTLVSTCVILSGMTNIVCLLYVGWVTNYIANVYIKVPMPVPEKKLEGDKKGDTLRIIERLDRLENVVNQHIQETPLKGEDVLGDKSFSDSSLFAHWGQELSADSRRVALKMFQYYGYNGYLSDRLALDRAIPDLRPDGCKNITYPSNLPQVSIVFIFVNEALSVILRSIHSAMHRTPSHLLKEIILVDDNSDNDELKEKLQDFVSETNSQRPGFIKVVRHDKQEGLIRSRVSGWRAATAPVVALFDAHVEFNIGWAEPVLMRIQEDRTRIISPSFDNIKYDTFEIEEYPLSAQGFDWELWCRYLNPPKSWWHQANNSAPIRSPSLIGCFVVDRLYFEEIGLLDEGMEVYGGENVELGVRLKNSLKSDLCLDQGPDTDNVPILYLCHGMTPQNVYYTSTQQLHVGVLSPTIDDDDNKCLVDVNSRPRLIECSYATAKRMKLHWLFTQGGSIQNRKSKRCLELVASNDNEFGYQLALQKCTGQKWSITNTLPGSAL
ncbi:polypeptide N-acetylgalactosaminyltransferase 18-like isoform X2 [Salvelinus alpinus]|uniref:polypeptide N-acetylgalactosaminyltransferase 18-like isoform X2 n=1 Tax=Salvelinus alpinus TaxID=8036 RepID=UPI0039FBBF13